MIWFLEINESKLNGVDEFDGNGVVTSKIWSGHAWIGTTLICLLFYYNSEYVTIYECVACANKLDSTVEIA